MLQSGAALGNQAAVTGARGACINSPVGATGARPPPRGATMSPEELELRSEQLRRTTDPATLSFSSTAELAPLEEIIGQERAVRSIDFGVDIRSEGFNIFAVGPAGSGRTTTVRRFL
ncbi:MAG: hypothetical protein FJZ90_16025, partial [Chloroflexi bacterium]|nr:hypothetical protein [Chloroflexota bacterium]